MQRLAVADGFDAIAAQGDDQRLVMRFGPVGHGGIELALGPAAEQGKFGFIGHHNAGQRRHGRGVGEEGRGVEHAGDAAVPGQFERAAAGGLGDFLLHQQHIAAGHARHRGLGIGGRHGAIGARQHGNAVLAGRIDKDHGNAGGLGGAAHLGQIDPGALEQLQSRRGKAVLPHGRDMAHLGAGTPRRQRLVGALATGRHGEGAAGHSLARLGQARHGADLIKIGGAEYGDHCKIFSIVFQLRMVSSQSLPTAA